MSSILPNKCPSCNNDLVVKSLACENCSTSVSGTYSLPVLSLLKEDEQSFVLKFIKYSGSLKQMAKEMKLSYPTVRNILNDVISNIEKLEIESMEGNDEEI